MQEEAIARGAIGLRRSSDIEERALRLSTILAKNKRRCRPASRFPAGQRSASAAELFRCLERTSMASFGLLAALAEAFFYVIFHQLHEIGGEHGAAQGDGLLAVDEHRRGG